MMSVERRLNSSGTSSQDSISCSSMVKSMIYWADKEKHQKLSQEDVDVRRHSRTVHSARNEETIHDRTGKPASENVQDKANFEELIMGSDTAEFVNKVRNQVRNRQKRMSSDVAEDCTEHSIIWGMFMATTLNAATFMGKSCSTMRNVLQNEKKITLKQMFDVIATTINNDEEVHCLAKIEYQRNTWTKLSLINDLVVIGLQSTKVYVFSDSVLCLGKVFQHPECNEAWKNRVAGARAERDYSDFDDIKVSQRSSSGIFSQDSLRCSSMVKSKIYWADWEKSQKISPEESHLCRCSTFLWNER